ncbi:MAG: GNAT family N-acetyltransferase [Saprospiraceae bacterium]|nr:GNAT family N-acetyltransferase [Saprospiraceae bacterium]
MKNLTLEQITKKEVLQLQKIGRQTFIETFSDVNTPENMQLYLEERFSIEKLTAELMDKNASFYFSKLNSQAIGYLKINIGSAQTELKDEKALEIERIYVLKEFHGLKVGQFLFDHAVQIAKRIVWNIFWLGVWEENKKAINFYKKNGFTAFDKHQFVLGNETQTDIMMKFILNYD